jgi:hypothetical protein
MKNALKTKNLYGSYPKKKNSQNEVHQVGPKNAGSQNLSFLAFEGETVCVTQICVHRRVTDGIFFCSNHVFDP